jgi:hypothetical protein
MIDPSMSNSLADLAARIEAEHAAASEAARNHVEHAMLAGELLIEAKAQLGHGRWLPWLADRGIVERTAQLYMRLARNKETIKSATVADLTVRGAIMMLAPQASPEEIEDLKLGRLGDGETWLPIDDVVHRPEVHCRAEPHDPEWIEHLSAILDLVPAIEINQNNEIIDGLARWGAAKRVGATEIRVKVTQVVPSKRFLTDTIDLEHLELSIERNVTGGHGLPHIRSQLKPWAQHLQDHMFAEERAKRAREVGDEAEAERHQADAVRSYGIFKALSKPISEARMINEH